MITNHTDETTTTYSDTELRDGRRFTGQHGKATADVRVVVTAYTVMAEGVVVYRGNTYPVRHVHFERGETFGSWGVRVWAANGRDMLTVPLTDGGAWIVDGRDAHRVRMAVDTPATYTKPVVMAVIDAMNKACADVAWFNASRRRCVESDLSAARERLADATRAHLARQAVVDALLSDLAGLTRSERAEELAGPVRTSAYSDGWDVGPRR